MKLDEETRLDIVEAKEALERAHERCNDGAIGSARVHMRHAVVVLERVLGRDRDERMGPPPDDFQDPHPNETDPSSGPR